MKIKQAFFLTLYYGFARWLPPSFYPGGKLWRGIRVCCCRNIFEHCGLRVNIERGESFGPGTHVRIGNDSGLGINARIKRNTIIGDNVMMGPGFVVQESRHCIDRTDIPMNRQPVLPPQQVVIGNDVWIGSDVMAIGNRQIADGSVIGARTVLVKDFEPFSIVGGNPSRLIRNRKTTK